MKHNQLKAEARAKAGKGTARAIRREARIPAVIYGDKKEPMMISLEEKELLKATHTSGFFTTICDIEVDGKKHSVFPKDIQRHPVSDRMIHVDFLRVSEKTEVQVNVPIHVINEELSAGVKKGAVVSLLRHELAVVCQAMNVPASVEIDVAKLNVGESLHIKDIKLPKGAKSADAEDITVLTLVAPSALKSSGDAAEGAEAAEGEEAPAAE